MKKMIAFLFIYAYMSISVAQNLTALINVVSDPHCRTAEFQSGNGVIVSQASGGQAPYEYTWSDSNHNFLGTGSTIVVKTVGKYYLQVVAADNDQYLDSVVVADSINPISNFTVSSDNLESNEPLEILAYDQAKIQLINTSSPPILSIIEPFNNPNYHWSIRNLSLNGEIGRFYTVITSDIVDTVLDQLGRYEICLTSQNYNNCHDTICKEILLVNSSIEDSNITVAVIPDFSSKSVQFHSKSFLQEHSVNIYTATGKLIKTEPLQSPIQSVHFDFSKGCYVYAIVLNNEFVSGGKFIFSY